MESLTWNKTDTDAVYAYMQEQERPAYMDTVRSVTAENGVPYLRFPMLESESFIEHGFSTRKGGVSTGIYESMNLTFNLEDDPENVSENFRRMAAALHTVPEKMVYSKQTHTTNVLKIEEHHKGMGIVRERDFDSIDGLVTNMPGICLVTFYADCVPLYFVDPVKKAIGLSHSGWRGTVGKIGKVTIELMQKTYGSDPEDIIAAIGPSICRDCYEVSGDVIQQFRESFDEAYWPELFYKKENGKYQLDLWRANERIFTEAGIREDHIAVTNVCTHCNPDILFSHRTTGDKRGNVSAFLALKQMTTRGV